MCASDYIPISYLQVFSKIFESLIAEQFALYLNNNNLLSLFQSGFRIAHSCTTAVSKVIVDIRPEYDKANLSLICLLNYSFDRI